MRLRFRVSVRVWSKGEPSSRFQRGFQGYAKKGPPRGKISRMNETRPRPRPTENDKGKTKTRQQQEMR